MRGVMAGAALALLAGCAGGDLAGFGPAVRGGGSGLPATRAEARPDLMAPPGRRDVGLAVRTFAVAADGGAVEIRGALCQVVGGAFSATLATPGRLVIPDLGADAPALRAECVAGDLNGAAAVAPFFAWAAGGGNPGQRLVWGLGWTYGYEKVGPMRYPNLDVQMTQRTG